MGTEAHWIPFLSLPKVSPKKVTITGAFSNIGEATARELAGRGWTISTLTNRRPPNSLLAEDLPDAGASPAPHISSIHQLRFDRDHLVRALEGTDVFVNTYWIRFPHGDQNFRTAAQNCVRLMEACRDAGVRRFVQVGVSNAQPGDPLGYYAGKGEVDAVLRTIGIEHCIVRPTLVVGEKDVLTGNICWFLRRFPLIATPLESGYRLQPITRPETARIIADAVEGPAGTEVDAAGPDIFTFREWLEFLAREVLEVHSRFLPLPGALMTAALKPIGAALGDTILTREELEGLRRNLLVSSKPPLSTESVRDWMLEHGRDFGRTYINDTKPRFGRVLLHA